MSESLAPIIIEIETPASTGDAWTALTDPSRVVDWFTDASRLGAVGDPYRLDFGDESVVEGSIQAVDPGRRFSYTWSWTDVAPAEQTLVTWSIEPLPGGGSRITLVHEGWAEAGADVSTRGDHEGYWNGYLEDLAEILAEGG